MKRAFAGGLVLALAACAAGSDYRPPALPVPATWSHAATTAVSRETAWWRGFGDPVLDGLVAQALADSPDVEQALARVDQARAAAGMARAGRLPTGGVAASLARARQSLDAGLGQVGRYVPGMDRTQDQAEASASLSWDVDFAGGLQRASEAAQADAAAAQAGVQAARLAVAAEVVDAYLDYRAAQAQADIMARRRAAWADRRGIMAARRGQGAVSVRQDEESAAADARMAALLPMAQARVELGRQRLALLTGQPVQTALPALAGAADIPLAGEPAAGLPGDVLRLRPDLVVAEAKLRAAHARIGASLAEYWPKISLMGLVGQQTNALASFASGSATVLQGAAGLRWRLFDFGRVDAEVAIARGRQREALAAWRGAVLAAGAQVEGGFVELAARRQAYAAAGQQAGDLARAYVRAKVAFQAGEISRDDLRMAELAMQDGEDAAVTARLALARAIAQCHRALGL